jgi:hypothetical protein
MTKTCTKSTLNLPLPGVPPARRDAIRRLLLEDGEWLSVEELCATFDVDRDELLHQASIAERIEHDDTHDIRQAPAGGRVSHVRRKLACEIAGDFFMPVEISLALGADLGRLPDAEARSLDEISILLPKWEAEALREVAQQREISLSDLVAHELANCHVFEISRDLTRALSARQPAELGSNFAPTDEAAQR